MSYPSPLRAWNAPTSGDAYRERVHPDEQGDNKDRTQRDGAARGRKGNPSPDAFRVPWALIAVPVALVQVFGTLGAARAQAHATRHLDLLAFALVLAGPLALLLAGRFPRTVIGVTMAAAAAYYTLGYPPGPIFVSVIAALFLWGRRMRLERHSARLREEAAEEERRAGEERLRIAQELHDVLAHHISLINVQAGVALHLVDERPEQTREALAAIKLASKDALGSLRAALDLLRNPGEAAPRAPTAGLAQLPGVVDSVRAAGLDVTLTVTGEPRELPLPTQLAALRITQESLTNTLRHSGASSAEVELAYLPGAVAVTVTDDGRGGVPVPGNGLSGMSERAAALGGTCVSGPAPGGGFTVRAELPG